MKESGECSLLLKLLKIKVLLLSQKKRMDIGGIIVAGDEYFSRNSTAFGGRYKQSGSFIIALCVFLCLYACLCLRFYSAP